MSETPSATELLQRTFESGQIGEAYQQASMLVQRDADNAVAWRILGHIKQFQGLWVEARRCAEEALRVRPDDEESLLLMAGVLGALGQTDSAIAHCDRALSADPRSAEALSAKAGFLERAGRVTEALVHVEGLGAPVPPAAETVRVRALLRLDRAAEALEAVTEALGRDDMPPRRRYQLLMLKSRALDRMARYEESFDAAAEGNAIVAVPNASGDLYGQRADAVMAAYSADRVSAMPVNPKAGADHVFIAGFPRSGTTLVEQILDAHPGMSGVGEAKELDIFSRSLQQRTGAFVPFPGCAEFVPPAMLSELASAYESAMEAHGFGTGPYVNKNLHNLFLVGFIAQLFPRARFILTERDPRDVAVSCFLGQFRSEAMPHLFDMGHIAASIGHGRRLTDHWLRVYPERTTLVTYEDLVRDHASETKRLVEFAGLPWDDRCLRFYASGRTVMTLAYDQVSRPIYDSSIGRYLKYENRLGPAAGLAPRR